MVDPILESKTHQKPRRKAQANYALVLLTLMIVIGCTSGFLSYGFGKRALKGVNPVPLGTKVPKIKSAQKSAPTSSLNPEPELRVGSKPRSS